MTKKRKKKDPNLLFFCAALLLAIWQFSVCSAADTWVSRSCESHSVPVKTMHTYKFHVAQVYKSVDCRAAVCNAGKHGSRKTAGRSAWRILSAMEEFQG